MRTAYRSLARFRLVAFLLPVAIVGGTISAPGQSSVERLETSQQVKQPIDSSIRARDAVQKPNDTQTPAETGHTYGDYSWSTSMEVGYRFVTTGGSRDKFLSDLYLKDGLRLLDFHMDARSISGEGKFFDFLRVDATNGGGDASQYYSARMEKNRVYRFDATVRDFNFYRVLPTFALNMHNFSLDRRVWDFNLKLFPQRAVRVNLGYSRSTSTGPFFTTYHYDKDDFHLTGNSHWESNDYRAGIDGTYHRWNFFIGGVYRYFKNDSTLIPDTSLNKGFNTSNTTSLTFFSRDDPARSKAGVIHGSIHGNITPRFHLVVSGNHTEERLRSNEFEQSAGTSSSNSKVLFNNIADNYHVKRPSTLVEAGATYDITDHVSINDSFRYYTYDIRGDVFTQTTTQRQPQNVTPLTNTLNQQFTDYSSLWNTLQLQFNYGRKFSASLGWRTTHRDTTLSPATPGQPVESDTQNTNSFIGGARYRPFKNTNIFFDYEKGSTDNAFVRVNPLDFQRVRTRVGIQVRPNLLVHSTFTATDTTNPTPQVNNDGNFRQFSFSAEWEPKERFWLTGGYNYDYIFTTADILFFISSVQNMGRSVYYSRQHLVFLDSRFALTNHLDLFLVYYYIKDVGAPSSADVPPGPNNFIASFPLFRHNPEARIAYRFNDRLTANVSYRHYSYNELLQSIQDYRAQIVTTSLRFTF
jgi:hypothetical protein